MNKIDLFKTRIIIGDKVYLLAKDVFGCKNGHDPDMRDYREYSCLENILYLITHKNVEDAGVDLMCCDAPGISFYISQTEVIKLLNPNMYRDVVLIDGDIDFAYSKTITKDIYTE